MNSAPPRPLISGLRALAAALLFAAPFLPGTARAAEPEVYLTWHAPFGQPGATDTLSAACDTSGTDTLWITVNPGITVPAFLGMEAQLLFHAAPGESLTTIWRKSFIEEKPRLLIIDADPSPGLGYPQMFKFNGVGAGALDMVGIDGRLTIDYATPYTQAVPVEPRLYAFARVTVKRPGPADSRCSPPMVVECSTFELAFSSPDDRHFHARGPHRFVSLNSPGGALLETYRAGERHAWKPPGAK